MAGGADSFDKRPGDLEATRGVVRGASGKVRVFGRRGPEGWAVVLMRDGIELGELSPGAARDLAVDLETMAAVAEGRMW